MGDWKKRRRTQLGLLMVLICSASEAVTKTSPSKRKAAYETFLTVEDQESCGTPLWKAKKEAVKRASGHTPGNFYTLFEGNRSIYRGRSPSAGAQLEYLRKKNVREILIFKDWKTEAERQKMENRYLRSGFSKQNLHWVSFPWSHAENYQELCEETITALQIMKDTVDNSRRNEKGGSLFIHCTAGEDRMGYLAGLFRLVKTGWNLKDAYEKELCARGYADGNPKKPRPVADEVHRTLTPLFEDMHRLIKSGDLSWKTLDPAACEKINARRGRTSLPRCKN